MFAAIRIDGVCYVTEKAETLKNVSFWDKLFPDEINSLNKKYRDGITFQRNPQTLDFIGFGGFSVTNLLLVQSNKFIVSFNSSSVLWV